MSGGLIFAASLLPILLRHKNQSCSQSWVSGKGKSKTNCYEPECLGNLLLLIGGRTRTPTSLMPTATKAVLASKSLQVLFCFLDLNFKFSLILIQLRSKVCGHFFLSSHIALHGVTKPKDLLFFPSPLKLSIGAYC